MTTLTFGRAWQLFKDGELNLPPALHTALNSHGIHVGGEKHKWPGGGRVHAWKNAAGQVFVMRSTHDARYYGIFRYEHSKDKWLRPGVVPDFVILFEPKTNRVYILWGEKLFTYCVARQQAIMGDDPTQTCTAIQHGYSVGAKYRRVQMKTPPSKTGKPGNLTEALTFTINELDAAGCVLYRPDPWVNTMFAQK